MLCTGVREGRDDAHACAASCFSGPLGFLLQTQEQRLVEAAPYARVAEGWREREVLTTRHVISSDPLPGAAPHADRAARQMSSLSASGSQGSRAR